MEATEPIIPRIGAFVLETLTTGMYTNPLDTLREYVQNSFDAIREAERNGVLLDGAGRIEITIDEKARNITLSDNGTGISLKDIYSRLINIGMSSKNIQIDAGFRGIGRLAGIAYCKKLVFTTQYNGESDISSVSFDCEKLIESMSPKMKQVKELTEVMKNHALFSSERTSKKGHFFEVRMEGINNAGQSFLEWKLIDDYLSQIAPVSLDMQSFHHAGLIHKWLKEHRITVPVITITIKSGTINFQVFKPYRKLTYITSRGSEKIHLNNICFFPEDAGPDSPFWGWYAETNCPGSIKEETVAGFRLRKANIGIGNAERMSEIFREVSLSNDRLNNYFLGEIHIQDQNVVPNARRDGFEDSPEWSNIRRSLIEFARERCAEIRQKSEDRNIRKLIDVAEGMIGEAEVKIKTGMASNDEKSDLMQKMKDIVEKLDKVKNSKRRESEHKNINRVKEKILNICESIEKETSYIAQNLNPALDKKQRKIISEIIGILYNTLEKGVFEKARDAILAKYQVANKGNEM